MRAVRSTKPGVTVVDVDEPDGPGELIKITSASICASDLGYIEMGSTMVLGLHELAGATEDGRTVAIEAIFGCGECDLCLEGRYNLCATTGTTALGVMADGGMSEWFRARALARRAPRGTRPFERVLGGAHRGGVAHRAPRGRRTRQARGRCRRWCHRADGGRGGPGDGRGGGVARGSVPAPDRARRTARGHAGRRASTTCVIEAAGLERLLHRAAELAEAPRRRPAASLGVPGPDVQWPQMLCFHEGGAVGARPGVLQARRRARTSTTPTQAHLAADAPPRRRPRHPPFPDRRCTRGVPGGRRQGTDRSAAPAWSRDPA